MRTQNMPRSNNVYDARAKAGALPVGKGAGPRQGAFFAPPPGPRAVSANKTAFRQRFDRDHDNSNWLVQNRMDDMLAGAGRGGDTELAHVNPQEAAVLKGMGGSGTINPNTGLREYKYGADTREGGASGLGNSGPGTGGSDRGGGGGWGGRIGTGLGMALGTLAGGPAGGALGGMAGRWAGNKLGGVGAGGNPAGAGAGLGATGGSGNAVRDLFHSTSVGGSGLPGNSANTPAAGAAQGRPFIPQRPADYTFMDPASLIARPGQGMGPNSMGGGGSPPGGIGGAFSPAYGGTMFSQPNNPGMGGMMSPSPPGVGSALNPPQTQMAPYQFPTQVQLPWPLSQNQQQPMPAGFGGIRG